jgi:bifunctional lysine-specific demethylase and histidyl-hydroxylase NO66
MMLERLVNDVEALRKAWENEPLHSRGLGPFDDVFDLDLADDLITGRGLRIPYLRLLRDGAYLPAARFTHRTGTAVGQADGVADPEAILREFGQGATVVLRGLIRYCPPIAAFCAGLSAELGIPTSAGAYLTPPGSRGAGPHYDPMSVLVRQVHGSKHWILRQPPEQWPRRLPAPGASYDTPVIAERIITEHGALPAPPPHGRLRAALTGGRADR